MIDEIESQWIDTDIPCPQCDLGFLSTDGKSRPQCQHCLYLATDEEIWTALTVAPAGGPVDVQDVVAQAVAARGYRNGWSDKEFAGRQIAKLGEEVAELMAAWNFTEWEPWQTYLRVAGRYARMAFDNNRHWPTQFDQQLVASELADCLVVLLTMAEALGVDGLQLALQKATRDVQRGVRSAS